MKKINLNYQHNGISIEDKYNVLRTEVVELSAAMLSNDKLFQVLKHMVLDLPPFDNIVTDKQLYNIITKANSYLSEINDYSEWTGDIYDIVFHRLRSSWYSIYIIYTHGEVI